MQIAIHSKTHLPLVDPFPGGPSSECTPRRRHRWQHAICWAPWRLWGVPARSTFHRWYWYQLCLLLSCLPGSLHPASPSRCPLPAEMRDEMFSARAFLNETCGIPLEVRLAAATALWTVATLLDN